MPVALKAERLLMCEIKDSLTALEPSCTTHAESPVLGDNEILSENKNAIHHTVFSATIRERQKVINHSRLV